MEVSAKVEYGKLKKLIQAMSKKITVKVGLLANKGGADPISNNIDLAGLGAVHEFGCKIDVTDKMRGFLWYKFGIRLKKTTKQITIPARSWLQAPLEKKDGVLKKLKNHFTSLDELIEYVTRTGDLLTLGIMLGAAAVEQIHEAFATSGFGEWMPDSPLTMGSKDSALPLVDKGKLRGAVTYEVEENG